MLNYHEDIVIFEKKGDISIPGPKITNHTEFQLSTTLFDSKMTICHFL